MKKSIKKQAPGFTLPELLVVITLIGIIMLGIVGLYVSQTRLTNNEVKESYTQGRLGTALNKMSRVGEQASAVLATATVQSVFYTTDGNNLILSLPSIDSGDSVIEATYDTIVFTLENGDLKMVTEADAVSFRKSGVIYFMQNVNSLNFIYENPSSPAASGWFETTLGQTISLHGADKNLSLTYRVKLKNK